MAGTSKAKIEGQVTVAISEGTVECLQGQLCMRTLVFSA